MGMIKSEREYAVTKNSIESFKNNAKSYPAKAGESQRELFSRVAELQGAYMIEQLYAEMEEYEAIKAGNIPAEYFEFENFGLLLIALRIKNGLTQTELAQKLGVAPSQVSRDENNDYHGVSLPTIKKFLKR